MTKSFGLLALLAATLGGCASVPPLLDGSAENPSNPSAPESSMGSLRPSLIATTKVYLDPSAGQGVNKMDMSKMQANGSMQGMDNSKMQGMENKPAAGQPDQMQGMDHSKMPGMEAQPPAPGASPPPPDGMNGMDHSKMPGMDARPPATAASPAGKAEVEMEMKKTSDEMKKLSDELKAKSGAAKAIEKPPAATGKASADTYTCVMHPQINEAKPGSCPICGMPLVKKKTP